MQLYQHYFQSGMCCHQVQKFGCKCIHFFFYYSVLLCITVLESGCWLAGKGELAVYADLRTVCSDEVRWQLSLSLDSSYQHVLLLGNFSVFVSSTLVFQKNNCHYKVKASELYADTTGSFKIKFPFFPFTCFSWETTTADPVTASFLL